MLIITGSKGFVGKHLCRALKQSGIEHKGIDIPEYNLCSEDDINKLFDIYPKINQIIHLAAISHVPQAKQYPMLTMQTNLMATMKLLEKIRGKNIKFIYLSSASVFKPNHIYNLSKLSAELVTNVYYMQYGVPTSVIRTSNVYGNNDGHKRVVHSFCEKALKGEPITIEGSGEQVRVFTHVNDLVRGIVLAVKSDITGKTINITGETEYTIKNLAETVKKYVPDAKIVYKEGRQAEIDKEKMDIDEARKIGYTPEYTLDKGVKELIEWIKQ